MSSLLSTTKTPPSNPPTSKLSIREKILTLLFDGLSGTSSSKLARELREKYDEDKRDEVPRTKEEKRERQERIQKRAEINGGGDGVRTNDMQKEGWGGAGLGLGHA